VFTSWPLFQSLSSAGLRGFLRVHLYASSVITPKVVILAVAVGHRGSIRPQLWLSIGTSTSYLDMMDLSGFPDVHCATVIVLLPGG
jgi:hypothetical protein